MKKLKVKIPKKYQDIKKRRRENLAIDNIVSEFIKKIFEILSRLIKKK